MNTLSTGEVAKLCDVNVRTVIRWIEKGQLKGFKLPGRGNNRVLVDDFIRFLQENDMPIPEQFSNFATPKILIVDDDRGVARALQRTFKQYGYETTVAGDGFQAGVELVYSKPHLITLDLSMPGVDGYEVLEFVRNQDEFRDLKIIVISALDDAHLDKAIAAGADAAMAKPYDTAKLLDLVAKLLDESPNAKFSA